MSSLTRVSNIALKQSCKRMTALCICHTTDIKNKKADGLPSAAETAPSLFDIVSSGNYFLVGEFQS